MSFGNSLLICASALPVVLLGKKLLLLMQKKLMQNSRLYGSAIGLLRYSLHLTDLFIYFNHLHILFLLLLHFFFFSFLIFWNFTLNVNISNLPKWFCMLQHTFPLLSCWVHIKFCSRFVFNMGKVKKPRLQLATSWTMRVVSFLCTAARAKVKVT